MAIPHDQLTQAPIHLTYRLAGSVPKSKIEQLRWQRDRQLSLLTERLASFPEYLRQEEKDKSTFKIQGRFELALEKALHDLQSPGPRYLAEAEVARIVLDSWGNMQERGLIFVYAVCVMSNHVHVVMRAANGTDQTPLSDIVRKHKSFTANKINKLLKRTGKALWEPKYFDRRVRNGKFNRVMWYVLNNPVTAGLVDNWREWPGTYLHPEFASLFGGK